MEYASLSVEEIQRQLQEAEAKQAELNHMLQVRREEGKDDVIQRIRDLIEQNGYDYDDIVSLIPPKRRRGSGGRKLVGDRRYKRYVDPDNPDNTYVRGVLPGWMKQMMIDQGYDPSSKDDREAFKKSSLRELDG